MQRLKFFSVLTALVMLLGMVAACGGQPAAAPATSAPAAQAPAATEAPTAAAATEAPKPTEAAAPGAGKKFVIAMDATFPPMDMVDQSKAIVGFDPDMIAAIAKDQGFTFEIKNTAWDGIFAGLEGGSYDAILSAVSITAERQKTYDFSDPYLLSGQAVVVQTSNTTIKGKADLNNKKVGAQIGTTGADDIKTIPGVTAKSYDTIDLAVMDLANGQIDAVVVDYPVASNYALVSPQFKGKLKIVGDRYTNEPYGLTVQKGDPKGILPFFNAGLKDIKDNGTYNTIYAKWIGGTPPAAPAASSTVTTTGTVTTTAAVSGTQTASATDTLYSAKDCTYGGEIKSIEAVDDSTVKFTLCQSDVAFPSKVAFTSFQIQSSAYLQKTNGGGALVEQPLGTGPYMLDKWVKGDSIILKKNPNYNGPAKPAADTVVIKWNKEAAARLLELQAGTVDGIDNPAPDDFAKIQADPSLKLYPRAALNVMYLGFNNTLKPFDNEKVREAVAMGIDRQRIVDNFYPKGSTVADYFTPCEIAGGCEGDPWYKFDAAAAKKMLADAGFPNGFDVDLSYRDVVRGYLPEPALVAQDIQAQLKKNLNINVKLNVMESTAFLDAAQAGQLALHMLGWGADYPDQTDFLDYHFGQGATPQFGKTFPDLTALLKKAGSTVDPAERKKLYAQANALVKQHVPMVPIAHGGSATAFKADVKGAHASPLTNEYFAAMDPGGRKQLVWSQNAEPGGIYCADETDGESLRVCEQISEALLSFKVGSVEVEPGLADMPKSNADLTEWTFTLRKGAKFSDGTPVTAKDVVLSYAVQWDVTNPMHKGRTGDFAYFSTLFGAFLNAPPAK
jgi:peptide/nickel transport system substrate-binding protein